MERFLNNEDAVAFAQFFPGDTVTIEVYSTITGAKLTLTDDSCTELGTTGRFIWHFSNLDVGQVVGSFLFIMTNQDAVEQNGHVMITFVDATSASNTIINYPLLMDIEKTPLVKGDAFDPEIRIESSAAGLQIRAEISDTGTTIYKATSNVVGGADSQIELVGGDTFRIYRLHLNADETALLTDNYGNVKITATTQDGKVMTTNKKLLLSKSAPISWNSVPN
ncbi:MAG: hypothetical protein GY866_34930 [Proteobacteria bacterium]|nr:hypothetical protein [Pseudomonadota bacterium]